MLWPRLARALLARPLTDPPRGAPGDTVAALGERLAATARARLGRSLAIREVDSGSCNGCELEVNALQNVAHDLERFGLRFVASPKHADVLLVTGPACRNMAEAMQRALDCTPEPRWVVAAGDCAVDGGVFKGSYAVHGGVGAVLPVDLLIPGCPPSRPRCWKGCSRSSRSRRKNKGRPDCSSRPQEPARRRASRAAACRE